ncbi:MAG: sigma-70 family RNA polymerase sigma factor [Verrucomicrobia bacterium]|nr:sigma-70 family RNA polymerase sigma factor [Verrucomicrobiota bacterium]
MPTNDDGELMARLCGGEDRALDALMDRWQMPLRRFLYRYLHNEADACDVAEQTFVRIYRHREKYRPGAKFSTWMFSIALNLCRDHARHGRSRPVVSLDHEALGAAMDRASADAPSSSPDVDLLRAETAAAVRSAIEVLPEPLRAAVLLCEYEELSHSEAAAAVGCSAKAIETRLYRARQMLRNTLKPQKI